MEQYNGHVQSDNIPVLASFPALPCFALQLALTMIQERLKRKSKP